MTGYKVMNVLNENLDPYNVIVSVKLFLHGSLLISVFSCFVYIWVKDWQYTKQICCYGLKM